MTIDLLPGFDDRHVVVGDVTVRARTALSADKPPLLCLHGHPQTHVMWHRVAPALARRYSVVLTDLRGYGDTTRPPSDAMHAPYSKRAMALDQLGVMHALGFTRFRVLAHDRGARVAHRLALDHPDAIERLVLLDIAPTLAMYEGTTMTFARAYWHWFFLIQRAPIPESFIERDPRFYIASMMGGRFATPEARDAAFTPAAIAEYERCLALPGAATSLCEDYRASATIDLDHDRADLHAGRRLAQPLLVLWGAQGIVARCFDALASWRAVADHVEGAALPCGHYIPEEAPDALLDHVVPFLEAQA